MQWLPGALARLCGGEVAARGVCNVMSVGGGPGFDIVALALVCEYLRCANRALDHP